MSVDIIINHDPAGISARDLRKVDSGTVLLDWLIGEYGDQGFAVPTKIFLNGVHPQNEIDIGSYEELSQELVDGDIVDIIHQPLGLDPLTIGLIVGLVSVVATVLLAPNIVPPPTGEGPRANDSPNNRLSGQTNISRLGGRIPDIYGVNRIYPDLGVEAATEFKSHIKFVTEWLIIGEGTHRIEEVKSGETLIADIKGSSFTIFDPGDVIPELLNPTTSNEVNGQEVEGPNDTSGLNVTIINLQFTTNTVRTFDAEGSAFQSLSFGDTFNISNSTSNDGEFTFKSLDAQIDPPENPGETVITQWTLEIEETFVVETDTIVDFTSQEAKDVIGPFVVPGKTDEVQFDIIAPRGLIDRRVDPSVAVAIDFELILDELDSFGSIISTEKTNVTIADTTLDARFYTFRVPTLNPGNRYQASIKRLTNTVDDGNFLDVTKWSKLAGLSKLLNFIPPDVTSMLLTTEATDQAVKTQERRFNLIQTRKLRIFNLATNSFTVTLFPTARMADALAEHLTNPRHGNKSESSIDFLGLFTIQEQLDNDPIYGPLLGRFSYTFSTTTSSATDEFKLIANAGRIFINRIGDRITFGRDEVRVNRTKLFNGRIKKPKSEKKTIRFQKPNDHDGVELQWTEERSGDAFTVILPDTGPAPINTKKIDAAGIKNFQQAWNRAKIEFDKIKLQRETVEFQTTKEGLLSPIGDRIANVDGTDVTAQGGEIKAINDLTITSSEIIDFKSQPDAQAILRGESGEVEEFTVTPRTDGVNGFILPSLPTLFTIRIRGDLNFQVGTLYTFAPQGTGRVRDYVIQQMTPSNDGYVKLNLINYNAAIWSADTETPPPHETTGPSSETLAWNLEPDGQYGSVSSVGLARKRFAVDSLGAWEVSGVGDSVNDLDSGLYRAQTVGDDQISYEIKFTNVFVQGGGTVNLLNNVVLGTFVDLTGGQGYEITDAVAGVTVFNVTVEIREKLAITNTTGTASFSFDVDGTP